MKLVKFVPAIAATLVLAACSTATDVVSSATDAVKGAATATTDAVKGAANATGNAVKGAATTVVDTAAGAVTKTTEVLNTKSKSVVYTCNKGTVTATYAFHNGEVKGANIRLGKNTLVDGFMPDAELSQKVDSPVFVSGDYVLSVDKGLSFDTATKTDLVMVYKKGQLADEILAKNCSINAAATKKLNK